MKTIELTPEKLRIEAKEYLQQYLNDDENIIMCGKRFEKGNINYWLFTEYRALCFAIRDSWTTLMMGKSPISQSLPLEEVESIKEEIIGWPPYMVILIGKSEDSKISFWFDKKNDLYFRFTKKIREQVDFAKKKRNGPNHNSSERLKQLTQLFNDGLISEQEFESKRQEILKSL